jgi:predicted O-methyltransferase YrrM
MKALEARDAIDRQDGTPRSRRLRQITADTGRFLALMAAGAPAGAWVEIGTSGGYSTLWLSLAARQVGGKITTCEFDPAKVTRARETFREAEVDDLIQIYEGDARAYLRQSSPIAFCFLDIEKEFYTECFELVVPRLVRGGLLVADNLISHRDDLVEFIEHVMADERVDSLIVPVGKGEMVCRKT